MSVEQKGLAKQFAFSQNYIAFWDRLERANSFLLTLSELKADFHRNKEYAQAIDVTYQGGQWNFFDILPPLKIFS